MAHDNIEVELKLPLTKTQFDSIKKKIKKICNFVKSTHHIDLYYSPIYNSFLKPKYPYQWLTLRSRDGKYLLNYKHWYPEGIKYTTHCDEYEIEISDIKTVKKMLDALKFENFITVNKSRQTYEYKQKFEIALDEVKDLGHFIADFKNTASF